MHHYSPSISVLLYLIYLMNGYRLTCTDVMSRGRDRMQKKNNRKPVATSGIVWTNLCLHHNLWAGVLIRGLIRVSLIGASLMSGCVTVSLPGNGGGTNNPDNNLPSDTPTPEKITVVLSVSNPNPQVGEEVFLSCNIVTGSAIDPFFDFQPTNRLIAIDTRNGSATLIVDQTDVGIEFTFTCTVTEASVTSDPSQPQSIIPTATLTP